MIMMAKYTLKMVLNMLVQLKMVIFMEEVKLFIQMELLMRENFLKIKQKEKDVLIMEMVRFMKENLKTF